MNYRVKTKQDGLNRIQILEPKAKNSYNLIWEFELKKDDNPIILAEFYTDDCFLVINWDAWIRAYNVSTKELVFEKQYKGNINSGAKLNKEKSLLYLSTAPDKKDPSLIIISLPDFKEKTILALKDDLLRLQNEYMHLLPDGKVAYYFDIEDNEKREHGFRVIETHTGNIETFKLKHPHWNDFMEPYQLPVLNTRLNIGAMTCWDLIEVKENNAGEIFFPYKIMLFNLTDFSVEKVLTIYDVPKNQLSVYESECDSLAESLSSKEIDDEDFKEAFIEYSDLLQSIYFETESKCLWASFSGGILSRTELESNSSRVYGMVSKDENGSKGILNNLYFYGSIQNIADNEVIIEEHQKYYSAELPPATAFEKSDIIPFEIVVIEDEISMSEEKKEAQEDFGYTVVKVDDIENDADIIKALDQIITLSKNIDEIRSGHYLRFRIKDADNIIEEDTFFKKAVSVNNAEKKITQIIKNFTAYKDAGALYYDVETTSLAHAVHALIQLSDKHINTVILYLSVIDFEHDVFCRDVLMKELAMLDAKHGKSIKKQLAKLEEGPWLEGYNDWLEEM